MKVIDLFHQIRRRLDESGQEYIDDDIIMYAIYLAQTNLIVRYIASNRKQYIYKCFREYVFYTDASSTTENNPLYGYNLDYTFTSTFFVPYSILRAYNASIYSDGMTKLLFRLRYVDPHVFLTDTQYPPYTIGVHSNYTVREHWQKHKHGRYVFTIYGNKAYHNIYEDNSIKPYHFVVGAYVTQNFEDVDTELLLPDVCMPHIIDEACKLLLMKDELRSDKKNTGNISDWYKGQYQLTRSAQNNQKSEQQDYNTQKQP